MQVLAIIAEYNPFHHGHRYLIEAAQKKQNFDGIICVMSPDFVQRGEAALCSKWARTQMALRGGVDLLIALPFVYAVRSAYYFARGAMEIIAQCGVASHLAFGSESGDLKQLQYLAQIITEEPEKYKELIKKHLTQGLSFPAARARALHNYLKSGDKEMVSLLEEPNNILALEYLRAIYELGLPIQAISIKRKGSGYHDSKLSQVSSATAIRHALLNSMPLDRIAPSLPQYSWEILKREIALGQAPINSALLETAILSRLRTMSRQEIKQIYEVSEGLENRIYEAAHSCGTLEGLRQYIKSQELYPATAGCIKTSDLLQIVSNCCLCIISREVRITSRVLLITICFPAPNFTSTAIIMSAPIWAAASTGTRSVTAPSTSSI
jgi:predicted nucleotidyltransferase